MSDFDFSLENFNELQNNLKKVLKSYPNLAEDKLEIEESCQETGCSYKTAYYPELVKQFMTSV